VKLPVVVWKPGSG